MAVDGGSVFGDRPWAVFCCPDVVTTDCEATDMNYLIVFLGAGIGGAGRHGVNALAARLVGTAFPAGTLVINVLGCLLMGLIAGFFAFRGHLPQEARLFLATGLLGGFTTFSSFSLQTLDLLRSGAVVRATINIAGSVALCVAAVAIGHAVAAHFNGGSRQIAQAAIEEEG